MALLADALQPLLLPGLGTVRGGATGSRTLADLITAPAAAFDLNINNSARAILLDFRDPMVLTVALASDSSRLASASFQTASYVADEMAERDSIAWSLVKLYYASFYAGHALMRLCGEGCSYFGKQHSSRLASLCAALGFDPQFKIEAGLYHCAASGTALTCIRARGSVGGAHEAFWMTFGTYLDNAAKSVLRSTMTRVDAQAAFGQLDQFQAALARGSGYSWLSAVRNDLQYRLQYGVWHPERMRVPASRGLSALAAQWKRDPMAIDFSSNKFGPLGEFVCCCAFVIALCREVLWRVAERSTVGARNFVRTGPMGLLNDLGVTP